MSQVEVDNSSRLLGLRDTAARVVHARHAGSECEDLVQEAWARAAVAVRERPVDDPNAYAAAIAANLVRIHGRREACRQRWASRLFVRPQTEAADAEVVLQEEQAAMAMALQQLPAAAKDLLVAHTVHGRDTAALAAAAGTTPGAVAAGLARARAMLRVEYLLSFRRLARPDEHCLRILYAISAGDTRRQVRLGADRHVAACSPCHALAATLRERRRPSVATIIALRLARWGGRLSQIDGATLGQRAGVAGGLVGMGVAGALVLGGSASPGSLPSRNAPQVGTAAAAPLRMVGTTSGGRAVRLARAHHRSHDVAATTPAAGGSQGLKTPKPPVTGAAASAGVSPSGVSLSVSNRNVGASAPPGAGQVLIVFPATNLTIGVP